MAIDVYDAVNGDGLFDLLGKAFHALDTLNTATGTTVHDELEDYLEQLEKVAGGPTELQSRAETAAAALSAWQSGGQSFSAGVVTSCEGVLQYFVNDDANLVSRDLTSLLKELIEQMDDGDYYVDANTVAATAAAGGSNVGDTVLLATKTRGDGEDQENLFAETIQGEVVSVATPARPQIELVGTGTVNALAHDWPSGSGVKKRLTAVDPADSLLSNGDFEDADDNNDDSPADWIVYVGQLDTTVALTDVEVQTVAISGTPTAGYYILYWDNPDGLNRATSNLAYNATASQVQAALREIPGLESVTVSSSGTSPDLTHTITFHGTPGNINQLTSANFLSGGTPSIAHATTNGGDAGTYRGRALKLTGDGSENTALYQELTLSPQTVYFVHGRFRRESACTGEIRLELVDDLGGTVITDGAGNNNALTIDVSTLSDSAFDDKSFSLRVPRSTSMPCFLRIRVSTALSNGKSVYLDDVVLVQATELYSGGPFVAAVSGRDQSIVGDTFTITCTNDRAGELQTWFDRAFGMRGKGLLLPSSGSNLIPDSVIG